MGPDASSKVCGSCTFCCKVLEIVELAKPAGKWCDHCLPGKGCGIHGDHPPSCQAFKCQWLLDPGLPHRFRPDQTKVVLIFDADGTRLTAHCDPANPLAWRREPMRSRLRQQAAGVWGKGTVVAKAGHRMWVIAPTHEIDLGEIDPRSPINIEQYADGTIEVAVLPAPES